MVQGRRASDRKAWPWRDRVRFQFFRYWRSVLTVVLIGLVAWLVVQSGENEADAKRRDLANSHRDEARKYQACTQRVSQTSSQNVSNQILRDSLITNRRVRLIQIRHTSDPVLKSAFRKSAALSLKRLRRITFSQVPDCRRSYPTGFKQSPNFPDLVPAAPPRTGQRPAA